MLRNTVRVQVPKCLFSSGKSHVINVPIMGESITQGVLASWKLKVGDAVKVDDIVASIETDKVNAANARDTLMNRR